MNWLRECLAKRLATGLAVWMLALGVTIPFLDRDLLGSEIAVEAEHHEECSVPAHDHTICSQFGKQPWATSPDVAEQTRPASVEDAVTSEQDVVPQRRLARPTNPRAPPSL